MGGAGKSTVINSWVASGGTAMCVEGRMSGFANGRYEGFSGAAGVDCCTKIENYGV